MGRDTGPVADPPARGEETGPNRIEDWGKTWLNPNKERVLARVPAIALPNITGYWPQTTRAVRGPQEYAKRILDLLDFIPDFRAQPMEQATNGEVMFVRWIARGTGPRGSFEAVGVDRLIVPNGYVARTSLFPIIRFSRSSPNMWGTFVDRKAASRLAQKTTFRTQTDLSALPPEEDMCGALANAH